ncbi:MAG: LptF/LptG family permease [Vicinamibacterales bacterium]
MLKIFDRYLIRETLVPLCLGLVVLTFVLMIQPVLKEAEVFIAKGVEWSIVARVLLTLLPSALSVTIPMAVLLGILVGLGRLSADRELVAIQACGVSIFRLIRPIAVIAVLGAAATAYEIIVALPDGNQTFQAIKFNVAANRAEGNVEPRVFFSEFSGRTLYVRQTAPGGIWRGVFLADTTMAGRTTVYLAREGRLVVNREKRTVIVELTDVTRHTTVAGRPDEYEGGEQKSVLLTLDPSALFPRFTPIKGTPEMTIAELRTSIAEASTRGDPAYLQHFMIAYKFSVPVASLVLALLGLSLGVSHRKDGRLASFVIGFGIVFAYYVLLWGARAVAISGQFPAGWAPWIPNVIFGIAGVWLLRWRAGSADRPISIPIPTRWRRPVPGGPLIATPSDMPRRARRVALAIRLPHFNLPRPTLLDMYVSGQYLRILFLGLISLLGVFYIATFLDLADKLFRGTATTGMLLRYFYFQTPQYVYYVIPMAALVATLVTIGAMTKNSELTVIRACGVSLYRTAAPLLLLGVVAGAVLFGLQERVLASSNREADRLNRVIRGLAPRSSPLDRRWVAGQNGDIYHYDDFDQGRNEFGQLTIYRVNPDGSDLESVTHAARVAFLPKVDAGFLAEWKASDGWSREFSAGAESNSSRRIAGYSPFAERTLLLESPGYFRTEEPNADQMTYGQLKSYVAQLTSRGDDATAGRVSLQRKLAFPFVALVMTLLAVPFAVTTGRRGALYGIGVGIMLAIVYWLMLSVLGAVGTGGLLSPVLAAWTPNLLFAAAAMYMLLTVRT